MEKSKRKELEAELRLAVLQVLRKSHVSSAIKSEKIVKESVKVIAKKFGKSYQESKKEITITKPLSLKAIPSKKKATKARRVTKVTKAAKTKKK